MNVQVTGILRDPSGNILPRALIRFTSTQGFDEMVAPTFYEYSTNAQGGYDFPIVFGYYSIDIIQDVDDDLAEFKIIGEAVISETTPSVITIGELLEFTTPIPNQNLLDLDLEWTQRFDSLENHFNTVSQQLTTQLVDGDAAAIRSMATWTNETLGSQMAAIRDTVIAGDAKVSEEMIAYSDNAGNQLASTINEVRVDTASARSTMEAYQEANGNSFAAIRDELKAGDGNILQQASIYTNEYTKQLELKMENILFVGDDSISTLLQLVTDQAGETATHWQVSSTVDGLTSAIGMTNAGSNGGSELYIRADRFTFFGLEGQPKPFYIEDDRVHLRNVIIEPSSVVDSAAAGSALFISSDENIVQDGDVNYTFEAPASASGSGYLSLLLEGTETGEVSVYYNDALIGNPTTNNADEIRWFSLPVEILTGTNLIRLSNATTNYSKVLGVVVTFGGIGDPAGLLISNDIYNPDNQTRTSIRSSDFVEGTSGWAIFDVGGDYESGDVEFNNGKFRGDLTALSLVLGEGIVIPPEIDNNNIEFPPPPDLGGYLLIEDLHERLTEYDLENLFPNQDAIQISSSNYVTGISGWAIDINGNAEFSNTVVRGEMYATKGTMEQVNIKDSCVIEGQLSINAARMVTDEGKFAPFVIMQHAQNATGQPHGRVTVDGETTPNHPLVIDMPRLYGPFAAITSTIERRRCAHYKKDILLEVHYSSAATNLGKHYVDIIWKYNDEGMAQSEMFLIESDYTIGTIPFFIDFTTREEPWTTLDIRIRGRGENNSNAYPLVITCKYSIQNQEEGIGVPNSANPPPWTPPVGGGSGGGGISDWPDWDDDSIPDIEIGGT